MTKWIAFLAFALLPAGPVFGQAVNGELTANGGKRVTLTNVAAYEVDSTSERGYMDVVVVLSDRALTREEVLTTGKLEELVKKNGLTALRVVFDPNCTVKSASPFHPAFTNYISSAAFVIWKPGTYDEKQIAGRLHTDGEREFIGQKWSFDITFATPITLDPQAKTLPKKE